MEKFTMIDKENTKKYLLQIKRADESIRAKRTEIEMLKEKSISLEHEIKERVQTNPLKDKIGEIVAEIVDLEVIYYADIEAAVKLRAKIIDEINSLDDVTHITILMMRYVEGKCWEKITADLNYAIQHVYRLHGHALRAFYKMRVNESDNYDIV